MCKAAMLKHTVRKTCSGLETLKSSLTNCKELDEVKHLGRMGDRKIDHPGSGGPTVEVTFLERAAFPQIL